jgi:hypothetical protein
MSGLPSAQKFNYKETKKKQVQRGFEPGALGTEDASAPLNCVHVFLLDVVILIFIYFKR